LVGFLGKAVNGGLVSANLSRSQPRSSHFCVVLSQRKVIRYGQDHRVHTRSPRRIVSGREVTTPGFITSYWGSSKSIANQLVHWPPAHKILQQLYAAVHSDLQKGSPAQLLRQSL